MQQQRLQDYLHLIQQLLSCPDGEEWILLQKHEDLVNPELIQVMEQVAAQLAADGHVDTGKYLHNWAAQLHHILVKEVEPPPKGEDQSQAYIKLIQALLDSPRNQVAEILAQHQELIGPGLVAMMKQMALQADAKGEPEAAHFLRELTLEISRAWLQAHTFEPKVEKKKADGRTRTTTPTPVAAKQPSKTGPTAKTENAPVPPTECVIQTEFTQTLAQIADCLDQLNHTLATRLQPANPLWYMEVLERARTSDWVLTTSEVEHLIGVKPHCLEGEQAYHRGCWVFQKAGKIGTQTAWRVVKEAGDLAPD